MPTVVAYDVYSILFFIRGVLFGLQNESPVLHSTLAYVECMKLVWDC